MLSALTLGAWADTYTPLEFISNTNSGRTNTYYDTGYTPNANTKVEIKFRITDWYIDNGDKWAAIFSGRTANTNGISLFVNGADEQLGYFVSDLGGNGDKFLNQTLSLNKDYTATASLSSLTVTDGTNNYSKNTNKSEWKTTDQSIRLFSDARANQAFQGRIYYCNIYEGDAIKHSFIPVLKDNAPSFYCTICKNYATKGSSTFSYGVREYTSVEYIEYPSDGANNRSRCFDTGYVPKANTKIVTKFMANQRGNNGWRPVFSGRNIESGTGYSLYQNGNDENIGYFAGTAGGENDKLAPFSVNTVYEATCTLNNLTLNGTDYSSAGSWAATTRSITLFSNPEKDNIFRGRIYYFRIYEGDKLMYNFIPVKASDNSVGFFDTVNGRYIITRTNTDTQYFNAGPIADAKDPEVTLNFTYIAQQGSTQTEPGSNLFDGNVNTKWCWSGGHWSNWVVFHTDKPVYLKEYTLRTANDCVYRDPKKFKLYGALGSSAPTENGTTDGWTLIDSEDDANSIIPIERYAKAKFTVDNPGIYQYYMFKIEEVRNKFADGSAASSQEVQLAEFIASAYYDCLVFDENNDNTGIDKTTYAIKLNRTLKAGRWNTFCIPFNMNKSKLGEGAEVKELSGATQKNGDNYTMNFTDASTIEAGKPYMVKVSSEINSIDLFDESGIAVNTTGTPSVTDGVTFTGVYANGKAPQGSFIISNNVFYKVDSDVTLKAFRGYITVDGGSAGVKALDFTFDDDATGISDLKDSKDLNDSKVIYNLAGQRLDNSQFTIHNSQLKRGIYIVNGKKIMVK